MQIKPMFCCLSRKLNKKKVNQFKYTIAIEIQLKADNVKTEKKQQCLLQLMASVDSTSYAPKLSKFRRYIKYTIE